jgi:23S rRNA (guanosine2251-2'-O)-methyltransferase
MTGSVKSVTVYGRVPVLEALEDDSIPVERVVVDRDDRSEPVRRILDAAGRRGVPVTRSTAAKVTRLSGNGRHDQGVVAEIEAPLVQPLSEWLPAPEGPTAVIVLDGVTNPSNVGMILRVAAAGGVAGTVLPEVGSPGVGPLVIKASAGVALRTPVLTAPTAVEAVAALSEAGFAVVGLRAHDSESLYEAAVPDRVALVLGNESEGISDAVSDLVGTWLRIPMSGGVESLNVAVAAGVVAFELARRRGL